MKISYDEYSRIRKSLRTIRDVGKFPYPRGMLHCILQQKKVDSVKRKYHLFADRIPEIVDYWEKKRGFPRWLTLPPVMKIRLLMKGMGFSAKAINKALRNPDEVDDERLAEKIRDAVERDYVYSPIAAKLQRSRGKLGEKALAYELEKAGFEFKTEKDLKGVFSKTPDFYFDEPVEMFGRKIKWIESKALFGDPKSHNLYWKKQYSKYYEMFGDGIVVYWLGCIEGFDASNGSEFRNKFRNSLLDMLLYLTESKDEGYAERLGGVFVDVSNEPEIAAVEKIVDTYSEGRVVARIDNVQRAARILKNMGFDVVTI